MPWQARNFAHDNLVLGSVLGLIFSTPAGASLAGCGPFSGADTAATIFSFIPQRFIVQHTTCESHSLVSGDSDLSLAPQRILCSGVRATAFGAPFHERSCGGMGSSTVVAKGYHFGKHEFEGYVWVANIAGQTKNVSLCTDKFCQIPSCTTYPTSCDGTCVPMVGGPSAWQGKYMKIDCSGAHCGDSGFTAAPAHSIDGNWARKWETPCDLATDTVCEGNITHTVCMNVKGQRGDVTYQAKFESVRVNGQLFQGELQGYSAIQGVRYGHVVNSNVNQVEYILGKGQWSGSSISWFETAKMLPTTPVTYSIPDARTSTLAFKLGKEIFDLSRSSICVPPPCVLWEGCINWDQPWSQIWLFVFTVLLSCSSCSARINGAGICGMRKSN